MNQDDILKHLRSSRAGFVSGAQLAETLGVSRAAVWKHIKALERDGYGIEAVPSKGYRLLSTPDRIVASDLADRSGLRTIGRTIVHREEVASTNTLAMELAQQGAENGTVVIAESQTGGKGRLGRSWISPRGNLYLSVILRPAVPVHKAPLVTLMGAVAVAAALHKHIGIAAGIKWPNDILVGGRKIAGLLTEMSAEPDRIRHIVLGIGVNVNMDLRELPPDVRRASSTVAAAAGKNIDRTGLLRELLAELDRWYQQFLKNEAQVLTAWQERNVTLGNRVAVSGSGSRLEGVAHSIDADGRLILKMDDGALRTVAAGDVTLVKRPV
jgi:BirA family biotin operon repressor/biotin-[acetyl-CoA-carboxylase] ligase